jgi:putative PIN family toxin of toxin-antitoxin system
MNKRFVLDTNVIVRAVLQPKSNPYQAIKKAQKLGIILVSPVTWAELETVIFRSKFDKYISIDDRQEFLLDLSRVLELILETNFTTNACRDTKDNKYLELAVNGKAERIITGDKDLLVLNPFQSIDIITVEKFINKY